MRTERRIIKTIKYTLVAFFLLLFGAACAFCTFSPLPTHQAQARSSTPMLAAAMQPGTWSQSRGSSSWGGCTAKVGDPLWQPWVEAAVPQAAAVAVNKAGASSALAVSEVLHSTAIRAQDPELTTAAVVEDMLTTTSVGNVEGAGIVAVGSLHATTSAATEHAAGTLAVQETAHTTPAAVAAGPLAVIEALAVTDSAEDVAFAAESRTAATAVCFALPAESAVEAVAQRTALDNGTAGVVVPLAPAVVEDSSAMATPVVADNAAGITAAVKDNSPHNTEQALVHVDTSAMMSLAFEPVDQPTAADPVLFLTVDADMDAALQHSDGTNYVSADKGPVFLDIATDSVEVNVLAGMGRVVCLLHTCVCCHPGCFILLGLLSHHACQAFLLCFAVTTALRIIFWVLLMRLF